MNSPKSILLTGGTGEIGKALTMQLLANGYRVSHLSRKPGNNLGVKTFLWDVNKGEIDEACIDGIDIVVHLAGAGIADKRWTDERKKELIESRTKSIGLIYRLLRTKKHKVNSIVSASAIGYYSDRGDELMTEDSPPNTDFMAQCCVDWEVAVDEAAALNLRIVKFRTGVVLNDGGALKQLALPVKMFVGSPLGSGKQWIPWIHWQDVVDMYMFAIEKEDFKGTYNMVAPNPVTNKQLTRAVAKQLHKPLWAPNVPAFALKLLLGEMATIVLGSTKVSAQKIEDAGFKFKYPELTSALKEIYG
ncbi:TIGR01777 family oxidoreductase [Mucilaginibacter sp. BJC16-A38]|uniref:TIGR01777 family oxidoreductase n=1 Tax=Mucilaginibacter phenanthrenivorans TaxID=1234842 RepID=UPI002157033F|nr:TIGR01777 family oxidoreductase [Mucilaginibacter phenanthrenivorans]MCR8557912.1 TIGR01777 family oxidoreductase [Mucilaginibacter phenanthrenivorans]